MKGGYYFRKDRSRWVVWFPFQGTRIIVNQYAGENIYHKKIAQKCLAVIQGDYEQYQKGLCPFRPEKYTGKGWTDFTDFFSEWMKNVVEPSRKPATIKGYWSYYRTWLEPFFKENPVVIHEIQLDLLHKLKNFITCDSKGCYNIMNCLHSMMVYAWRARRVPEVPPFPKKEEYNLKKPEYKYLTTEERALVFAEIPEQHKPIFQWMMLHFRRIGEACALHKTDYDPINRKFKVWRGVSDRKLIDSTKTGAVHYRSCDERFVSVANWLINQNPESPFLFVNPLARKDGKRYTDESLNNIWRIASEKAGVRKMKLYNAMRHSSCFEALENGIGIDELQSLTDHKNRKSMQHYYEISTDKQATIQKKAGIQCDWQPKLLSGGKK